MAHSWWLLALGGAWCAASCRQALKGRARAIPALLLLFLAVLPLSLGGQAPAEAVASLPDLAAARAEGVRGQDETPFLLAHMAEASGGRTVRLNEALVLENAQVAARLAVALAGAVGSLTR